MRKLIVVGAGELGSRHLQALKGISSSWQIEVVDPNQSSLRRAQERFSIAPGDPGHRPRFATAAEALSGGWDFAVVATRSADRWKAVHDLLQIGRVRHLILEKILFSEPEQYRAMGALLRETGSLAWVNCPMRQTPVYQKIRSACLGEPASLRIAGGGFGLMTSAIHYLDFFAWLNPQTSIEVSADELEPEWHASKRSGYRELTGTLHATTDSGASASIRLVAEALPIQIQVKTFKREFNLWPAQGHGTYHGPPDAEADGFIPSFGFEIPLQSRLTGELAQGLIEEARCPLTPFSESATIHATLLGPVRRFLEKHDLVDPTMSYPFT